VEEEVGVVVEVLDQVPCELQIFEVFTIEVFPGRYHFELVATLGKECKLDETRLTNRANLLDIVSTCALSLVKCVSTIARGTQLQPESWHRPDPIVLFLAAQRKHPTHPDRLPTNRHTTLPHPPPPPTWDANTCYSPRRGWCSRSCTPYLGCRDCQYRASIPKRRNY
jgi:hypothetical protein